MELTKISFLSPFSPLQIFGMGRLALGAWAKARQSKAEANTIRPKRRQQPKKNYWHY